MRSGILIDQSVTRIGADARSRQSTLFCGALARKSEKNLGCYKRQDFIENENEQCKHDEDEDFAQNRSGIRNILIEVA
jgi:hypothetical protein